LLDELDKELEKRGHRFVRYADDGNIYVRSVRAGVRVLASVTRYLKRKLKLVVNAAKSAVDRPWRRTFLGFSFTARQPNRRQVSAKALKAFKREIRRLTRRTRGVSLRQVVCDVRRYVTGGDAYWS
jgi:RNA-directed DNA polymerase